MPAAASSHDFWQDFLRADDPVLTAPSYQAGYPARHGRSAATRSIGISVPSTTTYACPAFFASRTAVRSFGARPASRATVSFTYRQAVEIPTSNPAASSANVSPLRR